MTSSTKVTAGEELTKVTTREALPCFASCQYAPLWFRVQRNKQLQENHVSAWKTIVDFPFPDALPHHRRHVCQTEAVEE